MDQPPTGNRGRECTVSVWRTMLSCKAFVIRYSLDARIFGRETNFHFGRFSPSNALRLDDQWLAHVFHNWHISQAQSRSAPEEKDRDGWHLSGRATTALGQLQE